MFENEQQLVAANTKLERNEYVLASDVIMQELQLANWKSKLLYKMVVKESLKLDVIIPSIIYLRLQRVWNNGSRQKSQCYPCQV